MEYSKQSLNYSQNTPPVPQTTQLTHTHIPSNEQSRNWSGHDGQGIHWKRMDGHCAHSMAPHTNHEQDTTHDMDGILQTPLAKP